MFPGETCRDLQSQCCGHLPWTSACRAELGCRKAPYPMRPGCSETGRRAGMSFPTCQAQDDWLGWSLGSPPSESGPGLGLVAFCYAPPDKRPLWREGRHAWQGLLQLRSVLTEGCCGSISKPLPCVPAEHNVGLSEDPLWSVTDWRRRIGPASSRLLATSGPRVFLPGRPGTCYLLRAERGAITPLK